MAKKTKVNKEVFAKRLKKLMDECDENTYTLAEVVHLSPATISRYANAEMSPKVPTIESLARYFNINPAWLLGYDVDKKLDNHIEKQENKTNTIAAHLDGVDLTEEEEKDIKEYINYLLSKRNH